MLNPHQKPIEATVAYELHGNCYLNITNQCTLRCIFCPKFQKTWEVQGYALRMRQEPSVQNMIAAVGDPGRYREVVFCGLGEPTLRLLELLETAEHLKCAGARVRVNTDGLANLVHGYDVTPLFRGRVDAMSISLNAQDQQTYARHCRPPSPEAYSAISDFTRRVKLHVPDVTVTAIDGLPGVDVGACKRIAEELGVSFRRRVLDAVG
jgi:TatD family-associated radical SAM protein